MKTQNILPAGKHLVKVIGWKEKYYLSNDATWTDHTPELVVMFGNSEGTISRFYAKCGYIKFHELNKFDQTGDIYTSEGKAAYACFKNSDGKIERAIDDDRTNEALTILNDLMNTLGIPEGTDYRDGLNHAIKHGTVVCLKVYEENGYLKACNPRKVNAISIL